MSYNIIQDAKYKIYNSEIMLYVRPEEIEQAFQNIYVYENKEEFLKVYGRNDYNGGRLEGFNRAGISYLGPDATPHTVIHEILHTLSSKFDEQGHRIINGIMGDGSLKFANQINEGMTDYLTAKISGETPRNYIQGHKLFQKLEPIMMKYTKNPNTFMQMYIGNDVQFMQDFLNYFGKGNVFENLYENFLFMDDKKIDELIKPVEKNVDKYIKKMERKEKINNTINKIKNIFSRNKTKMLTDGQHTDTQNSMNQYEQFRYENNINNFQSTMTKEDEEKYNSYNRNINQNQQQYGNNEDEISK